MDVINDRCTYKKFEGVSPVDQLSFNFSFLGTFWQNTGLLSPPRYLALTTRSSIPGVMVQSTLVSKDSLVCKSAPILIEAKNHTSRPRPPWVQGHTYLRRIPQYEYRRDEGDCERDRSRYQLDSSISLNVFLNCLLLPSGERMVQTCKNSR